MADFLNATPGSCLDEWNHSPEKQVKILIGFAGLPFSMSQHLYVVNTTEGVNSITISNTHINNAPLMITSKISKSYH